MYEGENRPIAANLTCYVNEEKPEKVKIQISDNEGIVVRDFETEVKKGFNRIPWKFERNVAPAAGQINRGGNQNDQQDERARFFKFMGNNVIPGDYNIKMSYNGDSSSSKVNVLNDPRLSAANISVMKQNFRRADNIAKRIRELNESYQKFFDCSSIINKVDEIAKKNKAFSDAVKDFHGILKQKYDDMERRLSSRPDGLFAKINGYRILTSATDSLKANEEKNVSDAVSSLDEAAKMINGFMKEDWPVYQKNLAEKTVPLDAIIR
jgi:hypothetical protein